MKIHVVSQEVRGEGILARLALSLVDQGGFTISDEPRRDVDLNYFFPYLFWEPRFGDFAQTQTAAWFTHRDDMHSDQKAGIWDRVARAATLRLSSAKKYQVELMDYGKSEYVTPPLDLQKFKFNPRAVHNRRGNQIGVSGFVYPGGRKGEQLVGQLMQNPYGWQVKASGRGWPCPTQLYTWADQQNFYHSLDVFVCTSLVEGIGYPPLEALACGVPVVIPRGVGLFDDLPDLDGIHRYTAGDYADLERAINTAFDTPFYPEDLAQAVSGFTMKRWINDHFRHFEAMVSKPVPYTEPVNGFKSKFSWKQSAGVIYFAYGDPARNCAVDALASWHKHMGFIPAALVSEKPLGPEDQFIKFEDKDIGARWAKTKIYDIAPADWEYVLYLDADTEVVGDLSFIFNVLSDGWEFVICKNPDKYHTTRRMVRPDNADECNLTFERMGTNDALQWNGGVFAFRRCPRTEAFFKAWHEEWQVYGKRDQAALLRAMWRNPLRVYTLGNEWNTVTRYVDPNSTAGILHYPTTARRHIGTVQGRLDSDEAWSKVRKL